MQIHFLYKSYGLRLIISAIQVGQKPVIYSLLGHLYFLNSPPVNHEISVLQATFSLSTLLYTSICIIVQEEDLR